jgi:hypothetical protein
MSDLAIRHIAPLTVQDCHVEGWKNPEGAVLLSRPPTLIFDCVFTRRDAGQTQPRAR